MRGQHDCLVLTRNLPPLIGGMERLVWHIVDELRADYRVHVIGPKGSSRQLPTGVTGRELPLRPLPWFLLRALLAALGSALRRRPRIILAGSGLTAPLAWLAARLTGAHSIVYLHGLDIEARQPLYRTCWHPFIRRCDRVLVNSHFTEQLAVAAGVAPERIAIIHPGVALPEMSGAQRRRAAFRERHGLGDAPLMLYVGRITARKGLAVFIRSIFPRIATEIANARLLVIGEEPTGALLPTTGEQERIDEALETTALRSKVHFLGEYGQNDPELDAAYFAADVLIFPVQQRPGDNEGFGMVALEAAAHGLPTVAFAVGGVPDALADGLSGRLVPVGDNARFAQAMIAELRQPATPAERTARLRFAEGFAWPKFGERLRALLRLAQS